MPQRHSKNNNDLAFFTYDEKRKLCNEQYQLGFSMKVQAMHNRTKVMLKMKSRHVAGNIKKKKKNVVLEVYKDMPAWPGRHLLEGGEDRRYFGLKIVTRGVVEFECRNQREYDIWTQGVTRLLSIVAEKNNSH